MNVYVFTTDPDCPAHLALTQEAIEHEVLINKGKYGYGRNFSEVWNRGAPFVSLEHDIVPWPGAIEQLLACPEPRCVHRFPAAPPGNLPTGFGIQKLIPDGPAPAEWAKTRWDRLDGAVLPFLNDVLGCAHIHQPPVAHARALQLRT